MIYVNHKIRTYIEEPLQTSFRRLQLIAANFYEPPSSFYFHQSIQSLDVKTIPFDTHSRPIRSQRSDTTWWNIWIINAITKNQGDGKYGGKGANIIYSYVYQL